MAAVLLLVLLPLRSLPLLGLPPLMTELWASLGLLIALLVLLLVQRLTSPLVVLLLCALLPPLMTGLLLLVSLLAWQGCC